MNSPQQPFRFPKRLWLAISGVCFVFLFLTTAVNLKGDQPTAWRALLDGELGLAFVFGFLWMVVALAIGAFLAAVLGIIRAILWK
jgi:hypothetical protein